MVWDRFTRIHTKREKEDIKVLLCGMHTVIPAKNKKK